MADNFSATEGSGKVIATDDIAGVNYQRIKMTLGVDGVNDGDVNSANPMPTISTSANTILNTIATNTGAQSLDTLLNGTITALNGTVAINAQGAYTVSALVAGTWVSTLIFEGLLADGITWIQLPSFQVSTTTLPYTQLFSTTTNGAFLITGGGFTSIRVRASLFTSGTVSVALNASLAQQTISTAQLGSWTVSNILGDSFKASYSASSLFVPVTIAPTDIFYINGSATKTVRINSIQIQATQTTASYRDILLIKRSTANSAGTSTALTRVSHDSADVASTVGSILSYTANPTVGTIVGNLKSRKLFVSTTALNGGELNLDFTGSLTKAIVLRGVAEGLAINLNAIASAGNLFAITVNWTEE